MKTLIVAIALATVAIPATAQQQQCAPYESVVTQLADGYQEQLRTLGLAANGAVVVQFANEETGTWTILVVSPQGIACLIASGENWQLRDVQNMDDPA